MVNFGNTGRQWSGKQRRRTSCGRRDVDQWPPYRVEDNDAMVCHVDGFIGYVQPRGLAPSLCFCYYPWVFRSVPRSGIRNSEGAVYPGTFIARNY